VRDLAVFHLPSLALEDKEEIIRIVENTLEDPKQQYVLSVRSFFLSFRFFYLPLSFFLSS
jgi:hypothetical protein